MSSISSSQLGSLPAADPADDRPSGLHLVEGSALRGQDGISFDDERPPWIPHDGASIVQAQRPKRRRISSYFPLFASYSLVSPHLSSRRKTPIASAACPDSILYSSMNLSWSNPIYLDTSRSVMSLLALPPELRLEIYQHWASQATGQLALSVIPAMNKVPDQRLASSAGQQWNHYVPIPLKRSILINPLPLARAKPDKVIGYSKKAFTENQLATIDLLTDPFGRSYGVVDKKFYFPFIDIEFKAQAKGGSHYIATNQATCAGAIASNGIIELARRGSGLVSLDHNEPQFSPSEWIMNTFG